MIEVKLLCCHFVPDGEDSSKGRCQNRYLGNCPCRRERALMYTPNDCAQKTFGERPFKGLGCRPDIFRPPAETAEAIIIR